MRRGGFRRNSIRAGSRGSTSRREDIGAGELVDAAVFGAQDEPAVFVAVMRRAGETHGLLASRGASTLRRRGSTVQIVQVVQIVSGKLDTGERLPGKSRFGQMAVGELCLHHRVVAELGAQTRQRAVGGFEIAARLFVKKAQLFAGRGAGFGAQVRFRSRRRRAGAIPGADERDRESAPHRGSAPRDAGLL